MTPAIQAAIKVIENRRDQYVAAAHSAGKQVDFESELDEMAQMMGGFFKIMLDFLEEKGPERRELFMETLMPSAIKNAKHGASDIIHGSMLFGLKFIDDIANSIDPAHRAEAFDALTKFFSGYIAEIAKIGEDLKGQP